MKDSTSLPEAAESAALTSPISSTPSETASHGTTISADAAGPSADTAPIAAAEQPSAAAPQSVVATPAFPPVCPFPQIKGLSIAQKSALAALIAGKGPHQAARMAGVDRSTLYRWRTNDFDFMAALNAWRQQS